MAVGWRAAEAEACGALLPVLQVRLPKVCMPANASLRRRPCLPHP